MIKLVFIQLVLHADIIALSTMVENDQITIQNVNHNFTNISVVHHHSGDHSLKIHHSSSSNLNQHSHHHEHSHHHHLHYHQHDNDQNNINNMNFNNYYNITKHLVSRYHNTTNYNRIIDQLQPWHIGRKPEHDKLFEGIRITNKLIYGGFPYLFINQRTGQKAIFCLNQKAGSSTWKGLLLKNLDPICFQKLMTVSNVHKTICKYIKATSDSELEEAIKDKSVPRIMIIREPYGRLLSGYLDKIENRSYSVSYTPNYPYLYNKSTGFDGFVKLLSLASKHSYKGINRHFLPQSNKCFLDNNKFSYDYYLKMEHTDGWYEPIIQLLGLEEDVSTGWNFTTNWNPSGKSICFHHNINKTCDQMFRSNNNNRSTYDDDDMKQNHHHHENEYDGGYHINNAMVVMRNSNVNSSSSSSSLTRHDIIDIPSNESQITINHYNHDNNTVATTTTSKTTTSSTATTASSTNPALLISSVLNQTTIGGHNKGASSKLSAYFNQSIAINANIFFANDLRLFNYPIWDGIDAKKYIELLAYYN